MLTLEKLMENFESQEGQFAGTGNRGAAAAGEDQILTEMLQSFAAGQMTKADMVDQADFFLKKKGFYTRT